MHDNTGLAKSLSMAAMEGVSNRRLAVRNYNAEALEATPAGKPKPAEVRSADDLTGEWGKRARVDLGDARRKVQAIADSAKGACYRAMAEPMPEAAASIVSGWAHRTPSEGEVRGFAERFGSNYQAARAANTQLERMRSRVRVTHRLDVAIRNIDAAADRAAAIAHHGANERGRELATDPERSILELLDKDMPEGGFTVGEAYAGDDFGAWLVDAIKNYRR